MTIGTSLANRFGSNNFIRLAAMGAIGGSAFAAASIYGNSSTKASGGAAISASLITYTAFKCPQVLIPLRLPAVLWLPAILGYAVYTNDMSSFGGAVVGYAAFLLAL